MSQRKGTSKVRKKKQPDIETARCRVCDRLAPEATSKEFFDGYSMRWACADCVAADPDADHQLRVKRRTYNEDTFRIMSEWRARAMAYLSMIDQRETKDDQKAHD